jgi:Domain of unknown function (DUF4340)
MSFKKTVSLALILCLVGVYIYFVELPQQEQAAKKGLVFQNLNAQEIRKIEITKDDVVTILQNPSPSVANQESSSFKDNGASPDFSTWELGDVKGAKLDIVNMNSLFSALQGLKAEEPLPAEDMEADLGVYGLAKPALSIKVTSASLNENLLIGKSVSFLNKRYLKIGEGKEIYLIPETIFTAASKARDDFRDRNPVKITDTDVKKVSIVANGETISIEQDADKKWQVVAPINGLASTSAVQELFRVLRNVRVKDFYNDISKTSDYKLDKPNAKVTLEFIDSARRTPLEISFSKTSKTDKEKTEDSFYALVGGTPSIYSLTTDPLASVVKPADSFREKMLFKFATDRVQSITKEASDGNKLVVNKNAAAWKVNDKEGDAAFVKQWIDNLSKLEAKSFPAAGNYGFDKPTLKVTLGIESEVESDSKENPKKNILEQVLIIGSKTSIDKNTPGYFASANSGKYIFVISEDSFKGIDYKEEALLPQKTPEPKAEEMKNPQPTVVPSDSHVGAQ